MRILLNPVYNGTITVEYLQANRGAIQINIAGIDGKRMLEKQFTANYNGGRFMVDV